MICPQCQGEIEAGWKSCAHCGKGLSAQVACRSCGKELDAAWRVCPFCAASQSGSSTAISDSVVKELNQTSSTDCRTADGATIGGSININVPSAAAPSIKPEVEYENQVIVFLKAEGTLDVARPQLEQTRTRLSIPIHVAEAIERACIDRAFSGELGSGLRDKWDRLRPSLRLWSDDSKNAFPDDPEALSTIRALANKGDCEAQCFLAQCYIRPDGGVAKDNIEGVRWLQKSADQGFAKAERFLGFRYSEGEGVAQDLQEAGKWFERASKRGDAEAAFQLAWTYHEREQYSDAIPLFKKLADVDVRAMTMLAAYYNDGAGCIRDYDEAFRLHKIAASRGFPLAMRFLAQKYELGHGVAKNFKEARRWYEKAAEAGNDDAKQWLSDNSGLGGWLRRMMSG